MLRVLYAGPGREQPQRVLGRKALVTWEVLRARRGAPLTAIREGTLRV